MAELVMKYQQYAEYKDSGVEWLGEIPNGWKAIRVKYITDAVSTGGTPKESSSFTLDPEVCWFSPGDFHDGQVLRQASKYVTWKSINVNDSKIYKENSVLVIGIGATLGKVAHCSTPFSCNQQINVITPNRNIDSFFLMYSLLVQNEQMSVSSNASTIGIMNQEKTKDIFLALPSLEEQKAVTNFLDCETTQIDALIEKQKTLIKLLKEKRQAVISHAVTKGLNPDAPMKDSGVEWLGKVPEHWTVCALKHILATPITDGPHETPIFLDEGVPFISAEAVSQGYINFDKKRAHISKLDNEKYSKKYTPKKYDIYIVKSGATTGISAIVETDREFNIWSPLAVIRCAPYCEPYFTLFAIRSKYFQEEIRLNWNYGTQQNIGMAVLGNLLITYPPRKEAQEISNYLKRVTEKMNELIERAEQAIHLMQERRTALISAAVTGKIDVRGWVKPNFY